MNMKITVFGLGYVGLSNAVLLSQYHEVVAYDINQTRIDLVNARKSPIIDHEISEFLETKQLNLKPTSDDDVALKDATYIIIDTPTDYDPKLNYFNTSSVYNSIKTIREKNKTAHIIIKSTIPVGYTKELQEEFETDQII